MSSLADGVKNIIRMQSANGKPCTIWYYKPDVLQSNSCSQHILNTVGIIG